MPFTIIRHDITKVRADAIVNTANPEPTYSSGTDGAIYQAAGAEKLLAERKKIGGIAPGEAAVTAAFDLPATYLIHTVGPAWIDGNHGEVEILRACYRKSLLLAAQLGCESIAFPLIATGVYGFPKELALETALSVIREFLKDSEMLVILVVFGRSAYQIAAGLTDRVEAFIDENYVSEQTEKEYADAMRDPPASRRRRFWNRKEKSSESFDYSEAASAPLAPFSSGPYESCAPGAGQFSAPPAQRQDTVSLEDVIHNLGESFQGKLLRMIDERGMTDPEVYKRANVDRKLFSKIRCSEQYIPKKKTIVALAIALRLNLEETRELLASAGLLLANNNKSDLIVRFCIENKIYDIYEVNALLFQFDQPILG